LTQALQVIFFYSSRRRHTIFSRDWSSDVCSSDLDDKAVRNKFLRKAAKSLDGLDALVQDLLTLSQIETGQTKMQFENIDLYRLRSEERRVGKEGTARRQPCG